MATDFIPGAVAREWGLPIPSWMTLQVAQDQLKVKALENANLGAGEAEAIVLAEEVEASLVILDDLKARRIARTRGIPLTGTVGVVLAAKKLGIISAVRDVLDRLRLGGHRISDRTYSDALTRSGE